MSVLELKLIGKEKQHYETLESLYEFSSGQPADRETLVDQVNETLADWEKMKGGSMTISEACNKLVRNLVDGDRNAARLLYLYLSPIFFFVLALHKQSRNDWRETVTACGVFCERIVRNLFQELDKLHGTNILNDLSEAKFNAKNGRLMAELQKVGFRYAANLHGSMDRIYTARNTGGPHDVPPPEPIRATISLTECLPVYLDYLNSLKALGLDLGADSEKFLEIFSQTTRTEPTLLFGESEGGSTPVRQIIKDILYREGFFQEERTLAETRAELNKRRYNYSDSAISHALTDLSKGKLPILTKRGKAGKLAFVERLSPSEYFRSQ